jgi:hypothetical protein
MTDLTFLHEWCVHNRLFDANFEVKLKKYLFTKWHKMEGLKKFGKMLQ